MGFQLLHRIISHLASTSGHAISKPPLHIKYLPLCSFQRPGIPPLEVPVVSQSHFSENWFASSFLLYLWLKLSIWQCKLEGEKEVGMRDGFLSRLGEKAYQGMGEHQSKPSKEFLFLSPEPMFTAVLLTKNLPVNRRKRVTSSGVGGVRYIGASPHLRLMAQSTLRASWTLQNKI